MKKFLMIFMIVVGFVLSANAQTAEVKNVSSNISGSNVTITVEVLPTFTPAEEGWYEFIVSPTGALRNLLSSTSKSITLNYDGRQWQRDRRTVQFECSVENNSYRECRTQDFIVKVQKSR